MTLRFNHLPTVLETSGINRGALAFWRMEVQNEFDTIRPLLRPTDHLSSTYPHPSSCIHYSVVYYKEDDIFGIHPEDRRDRIQLTKQDVIQYEFDMRKFREILSKILGFQVSQEDYQWNDRVIPLGMWEMAIGQTYPVLFIMSPHQESFSNKVFRLFATETSPMIVVTPTERWWTKEITALFQKHQSALVPLAEIIEVGSNGWTATEAWREALHRFRNIIEPPNMVEITPYEFRRRGDVWIIRYNGEDMYLKDSLGLRCIAQLLSKPDKPIFVSDLKMIVDGQNPEKLPSPTSAGELVDPEYLRDVAQKYITCEMECNEAKERGDILLAKELQEDMTKLMNFLQEVKGYGGRIKEANEQLDSIRIAIYRAICRSFESIKVELPDCFEHFSQTICTGLVMNYSPKKKIPWVL